MYFQDDGYYVTRYAEQKVSSVSNSYRVCRNSKKKKKKGSPTEADFSKDKYKKCPQSLSGVSTPVEDDVGEGI